ncbi:Crinkler (CRN) [Phytophthora megakarya]|uniref:Crinkler (CRN) n=1 Tax=Phytophthora megakarya TaxID=4795 RepID=A0A225UIA9_9STRA|nr:Crinkler (CRN) [Phytophthora megakarya]
MLESGKPLPFFILDEMTTNAHMSEAGKILAAFQRNVFRVCGLIVDAMGTDASVTSLVEPVREPQTWMTIVSRFPTYQFIPFAHDAKQAAWDKVTRRFLVVNAITEYSRGRFTRVVDFVLKTPVFTSINVCDLLDEAFHQVSCKTEMGKVFMGDQCGKRHNC